jgi:hypothetical protein
VGGHAGRLPADPERGDRARARGRHLGDERALEGLRGLRADLDEIDASLDAAETLAAGLPHRARYLLLNHRLARRLVAAHREWLDEAERELGG